jgi:hypothetical protein
MGISEERKRFVCVYRDNELVSDSIPEDRREKEFCVRIGFCGDENNEIIR